MHEYTSRAIVFGRRAVGEMNKKKKKKKKTSDDLDSCCLVPHILGTGGRARDTASKTSIEERVASFFTASLILFLTTLPPPFISIFSVRCWQAVDQTCTQPSMNAALTTNNTSMQIPPPRKYGRFRRVIRGNMLCAASPKSLAKYMASQKILKLI